MAMSLSTEDTYIDIYGRKRNKLTHRAILESFKGPRKFAAGDAVSIAELNGHWGFPHPGLGHPLMGTDENGYPVPDVCFISSPNMYELPDITKDSASVRVREDGRFGMADFTLMPQWYFQGTSYLPWVLRKPTGDLSAEKYGLLWYNLTQRDFVEQEGSLVGNIGQLKESLLQRMTALRKEFALEVKALESDARYHDNDLVNLRHSLQSVQFANLILIHAPQVYVLTLLTFTGYQRHFLEALACLEELKLRDTFVDFEEEPIVNPSYMGLLTPHIEVAEEFYRKGVPVWLIRFPSDLPRDITILHVVDPNIPEDINMKPMPHSHIVYSGPASAIRNRACQAMKIGNVSIGHTAYAMLPGDFGSDESSGLSKKYGFYIIGPGAPPLALSSSTSSWRIAPTVPLSFLSYRPSVNLDKFNFKASPLRPSASPIWINALKSAFVDSSKIFNHRLYETGRGYAFPDPFIMLDMEAPRAKVYFLSWLAIRPAWMSIALHGFQDRHYPNPQEWKKFLVDDIASALGISDRAPFVRSEENTKRRKIKVSLAQLFNLNLGNVNNSLVIRWRGQEVGRAGVLDFSRVRISADCAREVIWDILDHNFRFELLALDSAIFPRHALMTSAAEQRDSMVYACFPDTCAVYIQYPDEDRGLGARNVLDRWRYTEAFRVLISSWPGRVAGQLKVLKPITANTSEIFVETLEAMAFPLYCQTFFDYFGRAPCIPHIRPGC